jgi:hypothetical protein
MLDELAADIEPTRQALLGHPIYREVLSVADFRAFMKHHVFAVWDFFTIAKRLQREVTCISLPWMPPADGAHARLINDIVLGEESDEDGRGGYLSHFQLYLEAMDEIGADRASIDDYLGRIQAGADSIEALRSPAIPNSVRAFVTHTLTTALHGKPHEVAASLCYGREHLIPDMFPGLLQELEKTADPPERLGFYLRRHILLDEHEHAPLALQLVRSLCGDDRQKQREATATALAALDARIALWDGIVEEIRFQRSDSPLASESA